MSADLDRAIDRAVREMLDVEPSADLQGRVMARIDERRPASLRLALSGVQRFAVLAVAAAVLVLVFVVARRAEPPVRPPAIAAAPGAAQLPVAAIPQPSLELPGAATPAAATARRDVGQVPARVAQVVSDRTADAAAIDPLTAIPPIRVAPIRHSSITPEAIGVHPLDRITEMQIAPLSPPDGRE